MLTLQYPRANDILQLTQLKQTSMTIKNQLKEVAGHWKNSPVGYNAHNDNNSNMEWAAGKDSPMKSNSNMEKSKNSPNKSPTAKIKTKYY